MSMRDFPKLPDYATHLPVLAACIHRWCQDTDSIVWELGSGAYSTQILSAMLMDNPFVSWESHIDWHTSMTKMKHVRPPHHELKYISDWDFLPIEAQINLRLVFVDQRPDSKRGPIIERLADKADIVVVHDSGHSKPSKTEEWKDIFSAYSGAFEYYKYRFDYHALGPSTTVLSNVHNVSKFLQGLRVPIADMSRLYE